MTKNLLNATILITGGSGSFGTAFIDYLLSRKEFKGIIRVFSRNETKQLALQKRFRDHPRLRYLIGDVRDLDRLIIAMRGVNVVIHAAVLRQISTLEYNPFEAINTNIVGAQHVIRAAMSTKVKRAVFISSSDVCSPTTISGVTKLTAEMLFIQSNFYTNRTPRLSVIRYSNVLDNVDGFIPEFRRQKARNVISVSDKNLSRFFITSRHGAEFSWNMIEMMKGGEIVVPKLPSVRISELASVIAPRAKLKITGLKSGDTLHETLITPEEMSRTLEYKHHFLIQPNIPLWNSLKKAPHSRSGGYHSADNDQLFTGQTLRAAFS